MNLCYFILLFCVKLTKKMGEILSIYVAFCQKNIFEANSGGFVGLSKMLLLSDALYGLSVFPYTAFRMNGTAWHVIKMGVSYPFNGGRPSILRGID